MQLWHYLSRQLTRSTSGQGPRRQTVHVVLWGDVKTAWPALGPRCWDSVEECLTADRLERIQQVLTAKKDRAWMLELRNEVRCFWQVLQAIANQSVTPLKTSRVNGTHHYGTLVEYPNLSAHSERLQWKLSLKSRNAQQYLAASVNPQFTMCAVLQPGTSNHRTRSCLPYTLPENVCTRPLTHLPSPVSLCFSCSRSGAAVYMNRLFNP